MRWTVWLLAAAALFAVFLVAGTPGWALQAHVNDVLQRERVLANIVNAKGSLWSGSADIMVNTRAAGRIGWNWSMTGIMPSLNLSWQMGQSDFRAAARPGWRKMHVASCSGTIRSTDLAQILPAVAALGEANIVPSCQPLEVSSSGARGSIQLTLNHVRAMLAPVNPIGNYASDVRLDGKRAEWKLRTLEGVVDMSGAGVVDADRNVLFNGTVAISPSASNTQREPLQTWLSALVPKAADGTHRIQYQGKL